LYFISKIIEGKINGSTKITGQGDKENALRYYESLLLINNKINLLNYDKFERYLIQIFPYSRPKSLFWYYKNRIIRYSHIYNYILYNSPNSKNNNYLLSGIELIENKYGIKMSDYINALRGIFIWFLGAKIKKLDTPQFDMRNLRTFYINKKKLSR